MANRVIRCLYSVVVPLLLLASCWCSTTLFAQQPLKENSGEAKNRAKWISIGPETLVHPALRKKVTVEFKEVTLSELKVWLEETTKLQVVIDEKELVSEGRSAEDVFTDRLMDAPIYQLLDRLGYEPDLEWFVDGEILVVTTDLKVDELFKTKVYDVRQLLKSGTSGEKLIETIQDHTSGPWLALDHEGGTISVSGNALIVRQTYPLHRDVALLIKALSSDHSVTFFYEPEIHSSIRSRLQQDASFDFQDATLSEVAETLTKQLGIDVQLDKWELYNEGIEGNEKVSLLAKNMELHTLFELLLDPLELHVILDDGVLMITTELGAGEMAKSMIVDVKDICSSESAVVSLRKQIMDQVNGPWFEIDQEGAVIDTYIPGKLIVRHTEKGIQEVLEFLNEYRKSVRVSSPTRE